MATRICLRWPVSDRGGYVNNLDALRAAMEADASLPESLYQACLRTGRTPAVGDVKRMYFTKVRKLPPPLLLLPRNPPKNR